MQPVGFSSSWFIHTVSRKRRTGIASDGTPSYGALTTHKCRIEKISRFLRMPSGKEILIQNEMVLAEPVRADDIYWFPSIAGETADDTTDAGAGRTPATIKTTTDKGGQRMLVTVTFP